jgi:hypothetical protein
MKIELTIKASYLPNWAAYEGLRELVQNGKDAETEFRAPLVVRHRKESNTLVIENEGCVLPHEALLFGHTTKTDRGDMIGKFGEGLKLGVLALVRDGHPVRIRSGSEVWVPSIERSEKFQADVLVFDIEKGRVEKDRVSIEVGKITAEVWAEFRKCFLFLAKPSKDDAIETQYGTLLTSGEHAGKLYVKGIFVQSDREMKFGYDFFDMDVDRDRRMVERHDLTWRTRLIWSTAMAARPDLFGFFLTLVEDASEDVMGVDDFSAKYLPEELLKKAKEDFCAKFGADAIPVSSLAESKDLEHFGKKGVVVNKPLKAVLQAVMGSTETVKENLKKEASRRYSWGELSAIEKSNLEQAIFFVNGAEKLALDEIEVVDFRSENLKGLFDGSSGRVSIAKKCLSSRKETLRILVHEVSHRQGADGDKGHVERIENIWSTITERLRGESWSTPEVQS